MGQVCTPRDLAQGALLYHSKPFPAQLPSRLSVSISVKGKADSKDRFGLEHDEGDKGECVKRMIAAKIPCPLWPHSYALSKLLT